MRSWPNVRRDSGLYADPVGPLGELGALFNPGMRHEEEEKRAKQMLREEEGTGRQGRLGIDLESGVVVIGADGAARADADPADSGAAHGHARTESDGESGPDSASSGAAAGADGDRNGAADGTPAKRAAKPGEPQVAHRSATAAPAGKARRRAGGGPAVDRPATGDPVGKARRAKP